MKKTYITPMTETTNVRICSCLMTSIVDTNFGSSSFSEDIIVGGTTTEADSRKSSFWDEE